MTDAPALLRFTAFVAVLGAMLAWEWRAGFRESVVALAARRRSNLALLAVDAVLLTAARPAAGVAAAYLAQARGWGLLEAIALPAPVAVVASVLALEVAIYWQHRLFHAVPWLWRIHRVHHSDLHLDTTTGLRFHPLEMLISMLWKAGIVLALGAPVAGVVVFEVLLNVSSMFNHGNVRLPPRLEALARLAIVTPDVHRVHHSTVRAETDSNFGFLLTWWDRLFGTWRAQPAAGHAGVVIGLEVFRDTRAVRLLELLRQPFLNPDERSGASGTTAGESL